MAMPTPASTVSTVEELLALPEDGLRHELLDGIHVVTPGPRLPHQAVLGEFSYALRRGLEGNTVLMLLASPADIVLGPKTLVQPDLFVVRKPANVRLARWSDVGVPVLAIEVLSPSTAARDRGAKRRIYQRAGVAEYWIVDLDARLVERWRPGDERPEIVTEILRWEPVTGMTPVAIDLPQIFSGILGDEP
jgi:Uma2 family endonuclease